MLENNTTETASTEVTSIRRRKNVKKSMWKTHRYFVYFESRTHVEISTSNRCHNFQVDSPFKIDVISTNFPRGISTSNRCEMTRMCPLGFMYYGNVFFKKCFIQISGNELSGLYKPLFICF